jgi:serine protease inhibitor
MQTSNAGFPALALLALLAISIQSAGRSQASSPVPKPTANHDEIAAATKANGDFAIDLYHQLAKEQPGKNLFFSPSSISSALDIATEGAVGETAKQMGQVLRFPEAARASTADGSPHPWNMVLIDKGQAALNSQFNQGDIPQSLRDQIAKLRADLDAANAQTRDLEKANKYPDAQKSSADGRKIANELNKLLTDVDQYELRVASALWLEKTFPFRPAYLNAIKTYYGGDAFPADFRQNAEAARAEINGWVEKQTKDRIKDLITAGALTPDTSLVITSAVYFKGQWSKPFEETSSKNEDFTAAGGTKQPVPMMHQYNSAGAKYAAFRGDGSLFDSPREIPVDKSNADASLYPDAQGFTMVELPYKGGKLSMVFLVPQSTDALGQLEQKLKHDDLQSWVGKLQQRAIEITIPIFKLETTYKLSDALRSLGMDRAFNDPLRPNGAQFDAIVDSSDAAKKLFIGNVIHKTFVEVNEKGTEAAAATAIVMPTAMARPQITTKPFVPIFRADKPFIFLIRHVDTGSILFFGRMTNPKS